MEINTTQPTTVAATSTSQKAISSDFETFLKMLTVQMQNQDPLNPVDSSDYAVQLATFSSVEQQVQTNDLLRSLQGQLGTSDMAEMANWVGKDARAIAPVFVDGSPITLYPDAVSGAETAQIVVNDSSGTEVGRFAFPPADSTIEWAGVTTDGYPYPPGNYTFTVESFSGDDFLGSNQAAAYAPVTEVRRNPSGETVIVMAGNIEVAASDVTALRTAR